MCEKITHFSVLVIECFVVVVIECFVVVSCTFYNTLLFQLYWNNY